MPDTERGTRFERNFAKRNGLHTTPASGSTWHSKMDAHGRGVRWSLKSTKFGAFSLSKALFEELDQAVAGAGGTDEIPMLAVELSSDRDPETIICMRESDFKALASERMEIFRESKAEARRRDASVPQLFRNAEE